MYPGYTECDETLVLKETPFATISTDPVFKRKIILLATAAITDNNIFANGLFQNVFVLYKMFESMGMCPMLIVNEKPKTLDNIPPMIRTARMIVAEELLKQPIPVFAYIEIGMSIDPVVRKFLRMIGSKSYKLYLGNILNIDIETPIFYQQTNFAHHVIGELDEVWVSPHYKQHEEYACYLNHTDPKVQKHLTVPYVWDPCFITNTSKSLKWRPRTDSEKETIVITEPNISFQKSSIIPILALERWYRNNKELASRTGQTKWDGQVVVFNGERLLVSPYFKENIYDNLELVKDNKISMLGRSDVQKTLEIYPYATFLLHQINNEYNYMTLELLYFGYPVIHNAESWSEYGYYYKGSDLDSIANQFMKTRTHETNGETYKSHAQTLIWTHSPYNPSVQKKWDEILTAV
jgi:hypothetical protein